MKIRYIIIIFLTCQIGRMTAQQLPFASLLRNQAFRWNPGMSATTDFLEVDAFYHKQWFGFDEGPSTSSISLQYPFIYSNMSLGIQLLNDKLGLLSNNEVGGTYAYKIRLNRDRPSLLSIGLGFSIGQLNFNSNKAIAIDPSELADFESNRSLSPSLNFGFYFSSNPQIKVDNTHKSEVYFAGSLNNGLIGREINVFSSELSYSRSLHGYGLIGSKIRITSGDLVEPYAWFIYSVDNQLINTLVGVDYHFKNDLTTGLIFDSANIFGFRFETLLNNRFLGDGQLKFGMTGLLSLGEEVKDEPLGLQLNLGYIFDMSLYR
ncbi:MAG: PorP/SprF family type IX secretion system membrane protein [Saprospiraceae bacterium]|nr:PorP/SprF family type IX secretion system membrane protein [Saprospiraceae bacterium]